MNVFSILLYCIIGLLIIWELTFMWIELRLYKSLKCFITFRRYPLVGSIYSYSKYAKDIREFFMTVSKQVFHNEPFVAWFTYIPFVFISKLEDLRILMTKTSHRHSYGILQKFAGNGILTKGHQEWKKTRQLMNPAFSSSMMVHYLSVFNEQSRTLVDILKTEVREGRTFDVWPYMISASIDTIVANIIGINIHTQKSKNNKFSDALLGILRLGIRVGEIPWLLLFPYFFQIYTYVTGDYKHLRIIKQFPISIIRQKKKEKQTERSTISRKKRIEKSVLEILLKAHEKDPKFTETQIGIEIEHLLMTGSESTAITGSFLLLLLGINQDIQQKVHEEIKSVCQYDENITLDHIHRLKYMEQCIKETIRLYPLLPITHRTTYEDVPISGGKIIPAHCQIICVLKDEHENSKFYPNPGRWNPDNFSEEGIARRPKNSFLGFGLGPRACIGSKYAIISLKTQLCYILRNFRILTDTKFEDIEIDVDILQRSKHGYPIKLMPRNV